MLIYRNVGYKIGEPIECTIDSTKIDGILHYDNDLKLYFICHNNPIYSGTVSKNLYGKLYSWAFRFNGSELSDEVKINNSKELKPSIYIDDTLKMFLESIDRKIPTLLEVSDILPNYNKFLDSKTPGMLKLINNRDKNVEIKFGRFIKSLLNVGIGLSFTDKDIESIHDKYLLYQNSAEVEINIVSGDDILESYKTENYLTYIKSSLYESCMNNKIDILELYAKNNFVECVVIKIFGKIIGRALLWTSDCGDKIIDRTYSSYPWVNKLFNDITSKNGYIRYDNITKKYNFKCNLPEKVPYLDTFYYYNNNNKTLSNKITDFNDYLLKNIDGTFR